MREYADDDGVRTVTFENPDDEHAFQIFVAPYPESAIAAERFRTDDPSGVMKNVKETLIDGVPATSSSRYNDAIGDTREVWPTHPDLANLEIYLAAS